MLDGLQFHHIGVACYDIDKTATTYSALGYEQQETIFDPLQNVNICFLTHPTMPLVELLAPVDNQSPVVQTLVKNGTTPYHTCYVVDNLEDSIKALRRLRFITVSKPKEACAIANHRVAFLYNPDMGLIELLER